MSENFTSDEYADVLLPAIARQDWDAVQEFCLEKVHDRDGHAYLILSLASSIGAVTGPGESEIVLPEGAQVDQADLTAARIAAATASGPSSVVPIVWALLDHFEATDDVDHLARVEARLVQIVASLLAGPGLRIS